MNLVNFQNETKVFHVYFPNAMMELQSNMGNECLSLWITTTSLSLLVLSLQLVLSLLRFSSFIFSSAFLLFSFHPFSVWAFLTLTVVMLECCVLFMKVK